MNKLDYKCAVLQIRNDKYSNKIHNMDEVIHSGYNYGKTLSRNFNMKKILEDIRAKGFVIEYTTNNSKFVMFRAQLQIDEPIRKILIYSDSIDKSFEKLQNTKYQMTKREIENMYLAHEYFHILEYLNELSDEIINYEIERFNFLGKSFKGKVIAIEEVAANTFAQFVTNSKINPLMLDLLEQYKTIEKMEDFLNES